MSTETNGVLTEFDDAIRIFRTERLSRNGCGNKEFKLEENLQQLRIKGARSVLTFGGAWSNHLHAFALACERHQLQAVAAVRGEEGATNELLQNAEKHGLRLHYLSRADYRLRDQISFIESLCKQLSVDEYLPEGGSNLTAVNSCRQIAALVNKYSEDLPTHIVLAVGTGATMAGVVMGAKMQQTIIGVPVVQDAGIEDRIRSWLNLASHSDIANWHLLNTAMPARYGKVDNTLLQFALDVHQQTGVVLDPIYNAKAFRSLLQSGVAAAGAGAGNKIVFVHTGGLGGCLGLADKFRRFCDPARVEGYMGDARSLLQLQG